MSKSSPHIVWSDTHQCYHLSPRTNIHHTFVTTDEQAWLSWLAEQTSLSFQGRTGHLYAVKEARTRGASYWYAYRTRGSRTNKRYLGKTNTVTLARLEEVAASLAHTSPTHHPPDEERLQVGKGRDTAYPPHSTATVLNSLLLPKLLPPRLPATLVERVDLLTELEQAWTHRLTLLSASAGFGKTTLLASWAARQHSPVAWLSLEEEDNDPRRFWSYVIAALRTGESGVGETALSMVYTPQPPPLTTILTALINDLAAGQQEIMLVLDDYHVIDNPTIISSCAFLLEHLPARLHVILAGRSDPPLPLPRLRARGQMIELRALHLRFTRVEMKRFLTQKMALHVTEADIDVLEQRVEGWAAGLQLAALVMHMYKEHSTFIQQLSGNQRFILEYMQEEILERQSQEIQDFLLHTSVLTRLHASLCQAVMAQASEQDSQQLLLMLEKANLFLVPLDEERRWYHVHSLFRDVLQARLRALHPDRVPLLHQRAARWYAQQGNIFEAVEHALTGADYAFAADLIESSAAQMWADGQSETLINWFRQLPDTSLLAHSRLILTGLLYLLNQTFYAPDEQWSAAVNSTEELIVRMERLLERSEAEDVPEMSLLRKRIALLRGWIVTRDLHWHTDIDEKRHHTAQMQELAREDTSVWQMIPFFNFQSWEAKKVALLPTLFALKQQAEAEEYEYEAIRVMAWIGEAYALAGQSHQAAQLYREGLQRLQCLGKARAMFGYFHLHLAWYHWEWNQLEEARSHLTVAQHFAQSWQHIDIQVRCSYLFFQMLLVEGKHSEAAQVLTEVEQYTQHSQKDHQRYWVTMMRGELWLAQGNLTAVAEWATHMTAYLPPVDLYYLLSGYFTTLVRVYLALQRYTEALALLAALLAQAERFQSTWDVILFRALHVVVLSLSGETIQARQVAAYLLTLTEAGAGGPRVYLDMGQPMQQVLQSLLEDPLPLEYNLSDGIRRHIGFLLAAFKQEATHRSQQEQVSSLPVPSLTASTQTQTMIVWHEPLTTREREVLHLLAEGATNQQIAEHLVIALATAKKHVANILSKLGAENRVQAVAFARKRNLF